MNVSECYVYNYDTLVENYIKLRSIYIYIYINPLQYAESSSQKFIGGEFQRK